MNDGMDDTGYNPTTPSGQEAGAKLRLHVETKRVTALSEAPHYRRVLSVPGGALNIDDDTRKVCALLDLGTKQVCMVWTNLFDHRTQFMQAKKQIERAGYRLAETMEAPVALIEQLHAAPLPSDVRAPVRSAGRLDQVFDRIVAAALEQGASDIHWQADADQCKVLFRVHGSLCPHDCLPRTLGDQMARTAFTFTGNLGGHAFTGREVLDGTMTRVVEVAHKTVRVMLLWGSYPTYGDGWDVVLRLHRLDQDAGGLHWQTLGVDAESERVIERALNSRRGLVLVTGAAASGKSTTLAMIAKAWLNKYPNRKLVTLDPAVEYRIDGSRQIDASAGIAVVAAFGAALRSDADAIMVSEITDNATLACIREAVSAGRLVIAGLMASSTVAAIGRLIELGASSEVIAEDGFLRLITQQSLLPVVCAACAIPWKDASQYISQSDRDDLAEWFTQDDSVRLRHPDGCAHCRGLGVVGRTAVVETLSPDREIRTWIAGNGGHANAAQQAIQEYWRSGLSHVGSVAQGRTAHDQALNRVREGAVSPLDVREGLGPFDDRISAEEASTRYERRRE